MTHAAYLSTHRDRERERLCEKDGDCEHGTCFDLNQGRKESRSEKDKAHTTTLTPKYEITMANLACLGTWVTIRSIQMFSFLRSNFVCFIFSIPESSMPTGIPIFFAHIQLNELWSVRVCLSQQRLHFAEHMPNPSKPINSIKCCTLTNSDFGLFGFLCCVTLYKRMCSFFDKIAKEMALTTERYLLTKCIAGGRTKLCGYVC